MYKNKYLKYKKKYIKLKNYYEINKNYNKFGGMINFDNKNITIIDDYKLLTKEQYFELIDFGYEKGFYWYDVPEHFIDGCDKLEKYLFELKNTKNVSSLYILCPGDSPYKIIKYFEKLSFCKFCNFVSFPFSRPFSNSYQNEYNPEITFNYLKNYIPNDFSNLIIMDSINIGKTIRMILDSMVIKNEQKQNSKFYNNNKKIINNMYELVNGLKIKNEKNDYIIDLYNFMSTPYLEEYLFVSEMNGTRCVPTLKIHSVDNLEPTFNNDDCNYFIEIMILSKIHYNWYKDYLKIKKNHDSCDDEYVLIK